jgi:hypothetical protein
VDTRRADPKIAVGMTCQNSTDATFSGEQGRRKSTNGQEEGIVGRGKLGIGRHALQGP